ncbi:L-glutamate gamma-semialdehyde dehydrogenase [Candidatus Cyanaurora vandensis]|uniref:L-glutamate gamma-semialdehyde dehydrogenase n=1 Tax=Candidatus Cyanaurora vandensis TaxID=2714958 RepID=UPI002579B3D8|nr:L-glutamate gamma-semialdehyde dehydrogenase [Candidatus Cyanaurora vandensis]
MTQTPTRPSTQPELEARIHALGTYVLQQSSGGKGIAALLQKSWWDDKIMEWAMADERIRVELFRLVDCLPALADKPAVARHMQEYLGQRGLPLPDLLQKAINFTKPDTLPAQTAATAMTMGAEQLAKRFICGATVAEALKSIQQLRKKKLAFSLDLLGEAVISEKEALGYLQRYLDLMPQLAQAAQQWRKLDLIDQADGEDLPRISVSVKLSALYSQFDPLDPVGTERVVSERLGQILHRAKETGCYLHVDMEQYAYKDLTYQIVQRVLMSPEFRGQTGLGLTVQAYLKDSYQDAEQIVAWAKGRGTPVMVRLVKGAYWDQEVIRASQEHWPIPVYTDKAQTDQNFERITELLLRNHAYVHTAIASHNVRSLANALALAEQYQVPTQAFEVQMLYGMADRYAQAVAGLEHRVRVYSPYGELLPGMAYLIRRLLENTANTSFLRQSLEKDTQHLLEPPRPSPSSLAPLTIPSFVNSANQDFAQALPREQLAQALRQVQLALGQTYRPSIGKATPPVASVNPANPEEVVGWVGYSDEPGAEQALQLAHQTFKTWRKTPAADRAQVLERVADQLEARRFEFIAWLMLEVAKPAREADAEVSEAIDFCRYYSQEMLRLAPGQNQPVAGETNRYHYRPRGVTIVIGPWNFPLAIPLGMTAAALVTGNTTILKPSEQSSVVGYLIHQLFERAGLPPGCLTYLPGRGELVGAYLVRHPLTAIVAFTGSKKVGCQIYQTCAELQPGQTQMKRVIAEMGGKNAIIVDDSADLDQAVLGVLQSAFGYSGQKCSACSRVIVLAAIHDAFVERLVEAARSLTIGPPTDPTHRINPLIDEVAQRRVEQYIAQAPAQGQVVLQVPAPSPGYYVGPTIVTGVQPSAPLAQEEIFGPILTVLKAGTFHEALEIANGTPYALTGGLYSRTPSHIALAQDDFEVGNLYINRGTTGAIVARQPFGGFKLSGLGTKAGGPDYLLQFLDPRTITENIQRQGFAPLEGFVF